MNTKQFLQKINYPQQDTDNFLNATNKYVKVLEFYKLLIYLQTNSVRDRIYFKSVFGITWTQAKIFTQLTNCNNMCNTYFIKTHIIKRQFAQINIAINNLNSITDLPTSVLEFYLLLSSFRSLQDFYKCLKKSVKEVEKVLGKDERVESKNVIANLHTVLKKIELIHLSSPK
jgi:hypothetical protein